MSVCVCVCTYMRLCMHLCMCVYILNWKTKLYLMETFMLMFSPSHKIVVFYYALEYSDEKHYKSIPKTRKAKKEFSRSLVLLRMANHIPHSLSELRQHLCRSKLYSKMANSCTKPKCQDLLSTYSFLKK